jgi:hypothetical protein
MKKKAPQFLMEIYTPNDDMNKEQIISQEEKRSTVQQEAGQSGNEEAEDIFETYYNNRFD